MALEAKWENSMRNNDANQLDEILAKDWRIISADGKVSNKSDAITALRSGVVKYESVNFRDVEVWTYPGVAVVMGSIRMRGTVRGRSFEEAYVFTDLFVPRGGRWRSILTQMNNLPYEGTSDKAVAVHSTSRSSGEE